MTPEQLKKAIWTYLKSQGITEMTGYMYWPYLTVTDDLTEILIFDDKTLNFSVQIATPNAMQELVAYMKWRRVTTTIWDLAFQEDLDFGRLPPSRYVDRW